MSRLYEYFLSTVLLMAIALFSMLIFHPTTPSNPALDVQNAIDRTYLSTLYSVNLGGSYGRPL